MASLDEGARPPRLPELFESIQQLMEELEKATWPSGSRLIQDKVWQGLKMLEKAANMLSQLNVFGRNEDVEELASGELRYLLVPAFQGALTLRLVNPKKRLEHLKRAREFFEHFLSRCHSYHVAECPPPPAPPAPPPPQEPSPTRNGSEGTTSGGAAPGLVAMAARRQEKIQRFVQRKETEQRLSELRDAVRGGQADDERIREYYLLCLRRWVHISVEEMESIDQEMQILEQRGCSPSHASSVCSSSGQAPHDRPAAKPFVLMRSTAQAKVFGQGYPSLATMTVNEWCEQQEQQQQKYNLGPGQVATQALELLEESQASHLQQELEHLEVEGEEEEGDDDGDGDDDDAQTVQKAQEWDDWKDTHPWGYGNRQNMG